ncbi:MAG: signal recognition particle protein [Coriobacteriaceae bacterium]|nr:signal recognition particle protein [Coriobacteriaceae bacterium]
MLENLSTRLRDIFSGLRGKGKLTEDDINSAMREIRMAMLEADVNYLVVKDFVAKTKTKCMTADVLTSLTPAQNVIRVVMDELTELLGGETHRFQFSSRIPNVIMLVGLQGSGKTTAAAKLAYRLREQNHQPLLVACDVYRPAAIDQLKTLGEEMGVRVYSSDSKDPVQIAREGVQDAIDNLRDVIIVDTAGRLHVDEDMMREAEAIRDAVQPEAIYMVVDAMTGQDVVNVAQAFAERVDFDGVIMSKMDGDARGGGALSIKQITGKPIVWISSGEKPDSLEQFHPDRMAKRILGLGDIATFIENAVKVQEMEDASEAEANRLARGNLNLNDFIDINRRIHKMGGISKLVAALPGGDEALSRGQVNTSALDRMEVLISSMTMEERLHPEILNASRRQRIAAGAGSSVTELNAMIKKYNETKKMLKRAVGQMGDGQMKGRKGSGKRKGQKRRMLNIPGMGSGPGGMSMSDMKKLNDMLSDLDE